MLVLLVYVWRIYVSPGKIVCICFVTNIQITATSKYWTIIWIMTHCLSFVFQLKLIAFCQRKYEWCHRLVTYRNTSWTAPFDGSVPSNLFTKLCLNKHQSICNTIAFLMELFSVKIVLWSSIKQFNRFENSWYKETFNDFEFIEWSHYFWLMKLY